MLELEPPAPTPPKPPRILTIGAWVAILVISVVYLAWGAVSREQPALEAYERGNIGQAYYYWLYWHQGDWDHPDWFDPKRNTAPLAPVAKYAWGLGLSLQGFKISDPGELPDEEGLVSASRLPGGLAACLVCLALYSVTRRVAGVFAGVAAAVLLAVNPVLHFVARHVLYDGIAELWVLVALVILCMFYRRISDTTPHWGAVIAFCLIEGLVLALAVGSKMSGLAAWTVCMSVLLLAFVGIAVAGQGERGTRLVALFFTGLCTSLVMLVALYVLNPYLHQHPLASFSQTVSRRLDEARAAATQPDDVPSADLFSRSQDVLNRAFLDHSSVQLDTPHMRKINVGVFLFGVFVVLVKLIGRLINRAPAVPMIGLALVGVTFSMIILLLPTHSPHYYLPMVSGVCLMQGVTIGLIPDAILNGMLRREAGGAE